MGINIATDIPAVGQHLQDHPLHGVVYEARETIPVVTSNNGDASLFWRSSPNELICDLHIVFCTIPLTVFPAPPNCFTLAVANMRPTSFGSVTLRSADPAVNPIIDPNYLGEAADVEKLSVGVDVACEVAATSPFDAWRLREVVPGTQVRSGREADAFIRSAVEPFNHAAGTCRMGPDDASVVDANLKVHGVECLRVADLSVVPIIPNTFTHATAVMIGEKAADLVRRQTAE